MKDLRNAKFKYNKIFIENLTVLGYIDQSSQYKNVGDFKSYNIRNFIFKFRKTQMKNDIKDLKKSWK